MRRALLERFPGELSGGELQRFDLARALSLEPKLLILYEPTAMLDVVTQTQILGVLKSLAAVSRLSFLFISHDLRLLGNFCNRAWQLNRGRTAPFPLSTQTEGVDEI